MARLTVKRDPEAARRLHMEALESGNLSPKSRVNCLYQIADLGLRHGHIAPARSALEKLTGMRRNSEDWFLLGMCVASYYGDLGGAKDALERAAAIAPFRPEVHDALAQLYDRLGETEAARRERAIATHLSQH